MAAIYHYTPSKRKLSDLQNTFVSEGGRKILESVLSDLGKRFNKSTNQHYLILGPWGIGKSHLLSLIYYGIKESKKLSSHWLPLWLAEEEYSIISIDDLVERLMDELVNEFPEEDNKIFEKINHFKIDLESKYGSEEIFNLTTAFFKDLERMLNKRFVIIFENFNMFLKEISSHEEKKLRSELMNETSLLFIISAPNIHNYLRELSDPNHALYNMFEVHVLKSFSLRECRELLIQHALIENNRKLYSISEGKGNKLKIINHITGGNPRLMLMLCHLQYSLDSIQEIESALKELIDNLTPQFQARISNLAPQQRKIFIEFVRSRENMTPAEVAKKLHLPTNQVTAQIGPLVYNGFLAVVAKEGDRRGTYYELSEPIFRYWYKYRSGRGDEAILENADILSFWFSEEESEKLMKDSLENVDLRIDKKVKSVNKNELKDLALDTQFEKQEKEEYLENDKEEYLKYLEKGIELFISGRNEEAINFFDKSIEIEPGKVDAFFYKGDVLAEIGNLEEAIICYNKVIELKPNYYAAYERKGHALKKLGKINESLECYNTSRELRETDIFSENKWDYLLTPDELDEALSLSGTLTGINIPIGKEGGELLNLPEHKQAWREYNKIVQKEPDKVTAYILKAGLLLNLGRYKEALDCYKTAIGLSPSNASAYLNMGNTLMMIGQYQEAVDNYNIGIELEPDFFIFYINKGEALSSLGKDEEAIECTQKALNIKDDNFSAFLNISIFNLKLGELIDSQYYFEQALELLIEKKNTRLTHLLMRYLFKVLKIKEYDFAEKITQVIEQSVINQQDIKNLNLEFLSYFRILINFLKTGDYNILDRQPGKIRSTLREMINYFKAVS